MPRDLTREDLIADIGKELRAGQSAVDAVDDAVSRRLDLNRTDTRCLDLIDQHAPLPAGRLAERAGITTGAVTGVLDRLERAGLARRVPDPEDRRRVVVEVTDDYRRRLYALYAPLAEEGREELERFSVGELETILTFLRLSRELNERQLARLRSEEGGRG